MKNIILLGSEPEISEEIAKVLAKKLHYGIKNIKTEVKNQTKMPGQRRNKMLQKKKEKYITRKLGNFERCIIVTNTKTTKDPENLRKLQKNGIFVLIKSDNSPEFLENQSELVLELKNDLGEIIHTILNHLKQKHGIEPNTTNTIIE